MSSFWKFVFDNEVMQRADIEEVRSRARRNARRAAMRASDLEERLEQVESELGEMRLFTRALLSLLQENDTLDPERIREKILEIDASDGSVDGRFDPQDDEKEPPPAPVSRKRRR